MQEKMNFQYFLLIIPGMVIFTIGVILPLLLAVRYSVTSWDGMSVEKEFVGISNYINLWKDANFRQAWWFTIKFTIANTIVQNVFALLFAVALDSGIKAQKVYRTVLFIPCLVSAVIVGFVWLKLYSNVLPELNEIFGTNINFLLFGDGKTVLTGLVIANNWQWIGYWMLIYLAGLQSVPSDLYEAAKVDGAGRLKRIWHITLPGIKPTIVVLLIMSIGSTLNVGMERQMLLSNGIVQDHAMVLSWFSYLRGIGNSNYGVGTAIGMFQSVVGIILLLIANKFASLMGESKLI